MYHYNYNISKTLTTKPTKQKLCYNGTITKNTETWDDDKNYRDFEGF